MPTNPSPRQTAGFHPEYKGYDGRKVKQADTILLAYPLGVNMSTATRAADLRFYAPRTDPNGPAMTWSMFALGWLDAHDQKEAASNFARGGANQQPPFKVWTETPHGGTVNFITGAGGLLQSLMNGYGGVRIEQEQLKLVPAPPPPNVTQLRLHGVHYLGSRLQISVRAKAFSVAVLGAAPDVAAAPALEVVVLSATPLVSPGQTFPLVPGGEAVELPVCDACAAAVRLRGAYKALEAAF